MWNAMWYAKWYPEKAAMWYAMSNVVAMWLLAMWDTGLVAMWTAGLLAKRNAANAAMQMISLQLVLLSNCGAQNLSQSASRKRYWRNPANWDHHSQHMPY